MKAITMIFLVLIFMSCGSTRTDNAPLKTVTDTTGALSYNYATGPFSSLVRDYHKREIVYALCYLDSSFAKQFPFPEEPCFLNEDLRDIPLLADSLFAFEEKRYHQLDEAHRYELMDGLNIWLSNDRLLEGGSLLTTYMQLPDILIQIPATKALVTAYFTHPSQTSASFAENQLCQLYYDLLRYLQQKSRKERIAFFRRYYDLASADGLKGDE
ncbi:MAG TPA: hypothetical protein VM802_06565 [Chitinophaga sp.]|uniref:hypothetical protein n=1 Tax=Chitinophaga sp. TaxID=1869181 RepID=UPI002CC90F2D|nr:hypothetical protein [Chitinophaga sp.]HVI44511.1 hypothetical protein [Chitinophaga sp.]